jgi:crotonobetainyl-CoA:carnitine CoA-transferase CaiB-like acyl-CoA transferase
MTTSIIRPTRKRMISVPNSISRILDGIRVADFTWIHAGPSATRILADQGAQVIRIESSNALDIAGGANPQTPRGVGYRHNWNAGKFGIALNMKIPSGVNVARNLVAVSDVVVENFSGRVMQKWGMTYEDLRRIKPDIIMLSMSGFGRTGPWKDYVSYGQTLQAWSGFTHLTGFPDTDPSGPASAYSDAVSGIAGAQALLLALIHRAKTGEGQWIDLSQFESLASLLETLVLDLSINNLDNVTERTGNRLPYGDGSPHGVYRCQGDDRWVAIAVFSDTEWDAFRHAIGDPDWASEPKYSTTLGRLKNVVELDRLVGNWTIQHTAEQVMVILQSANVASGVVQTGEDLVENDPHLKHRGFYRSVPDSRGISRRIEGVSYILSKTYGGPTRGAPAFGEHQTFVLQDILGMSEDDLAQCAIDGAFD